MADGPAPWRATWVEIPLGWFTEGPNGTELLLEPESNGRWRWTLSQHTVTAFVRLASGSGQDQGKAALAAEAACRRFVGGVHSHVGLRA